MLPAGNAVATEHYVLGQTAGPVVRPSRRLSPSSIDARMAMVCSPALRPGGGPGWPRTRPMPMACPLT